MAMKILIPFQTRDIGGPSSFVKKFQHGMEARGHSIVFEEAGKPYDILLAIVQAPFDILRRAKRNHIPIVQRLDGTFYWSVSKWRYPLLNLKARLIRHHFADYTVYQSKYSQKCAERFLGRKNGESSSIIVNGVDTTLFSPQGETIPLREYPDQHIFFTASDFRREDQLIPILKALQHYHFRHGDTFKFIIAGRFSRELKGFEKRLNQYPRTVFLGAIPNHELPRYERSADIFLFTHLNPPCPNNVLEAIACGLPVCGIADGAMPEIIQQGKTGLLLENAGDAFWKRRHYNAAAFAENIDRILKDKTYFSQQSRARATQHHSLDQMIDAYESVFQTLL